MNFNVKKSDNEINITLPLSLADRLPDASENDLKLIVGIYAYSAREKCEILDDGTISAIGEELGLDGSEVSESVSFWRGAGLLTASKKAPARTVEKKNDSTKNALVFAPDKKPSYSSGELADAIKDKSEFAEIIDFSQERLGKLLSQSEIATLYSLYDYLKMPAYVIMLAVEHCAGEDKGSVRYVEKLLISFADDGIDSYEKAECYINRRRKYKTAEEKIRKLCGFGERALTKKERTIIASISDMGICDELVSYAYERTVTATSKPSLAYMNKILMSWAEKGYKTVEEAESEQPATDEKKSSQSYDLEGFFAAAVSKGRSDKSEKNKDDGNE